MFLFKKKIGKSFELVDVKAVAGNDVKPMRKPFNWKDNLMLLQGR
jgi:hypothetical protein